VLAAAGKEVVNSCFAGYNACVFAYGQTGSGKTFTMLGEISAAHAALSSSSGLIPRIFDHMLSEMQRREDQPPEGCDELRYECHIGMLEIYNESITDLLNPEATNLLIREDAQHGIRVESLSQRRVQSGAGCFRFDVLWGRSTFSLHACLGTVPHSYFAVQFRMCYPYLTKGQKTATLARHG
jgi:kinesin family member 15